MKQPTKARLTSRISPARQSSVAAFVISIVTGRDPSEIDPSDQLASWGFDDRNIGSLEDTINKARWHNVQVTDQEIERCKTIQGGRGYSLNTAMFAVPGVN
jgi:hypothetical protein